jgi:hypothetical protein
MHRWTDAEILFLKENIAGKSYAEMRKLFNKHFHSRLSLGQITGMLKYHKLRNGICHCQSYKNLPAGKGIKGRYPGSKKTQFKPKQKPWNYIPLGSERVNYNGIVDVKVRETPPRKCKSKHLIIWEQANGPIPKGHQIIFADRNKRNFELSNLILVSRKEMAVMNKNRMAFTCAETAETCKLIADIKILASTRVKNEKLKITERA